MYIRLQVGYRIPKDQFEELFVQFDTDGGGTINFDEFKGFLRRAYVYTYVYECMCMCMCFDEFKGLLRSTDVCIGGRYITHVSLTNSTWDVSGART